MEQKAETALGTGLDVERCGHCGGSVRAGAPWCTLCLTPTRAAVAVPEPPVRPVRPSRPRGKHAAPSDEDLAVWPCATCDSPNPLEASACTTCGAGFLEAVARAEPPLLVLPGVGDASRLGRLHWTGLGAALLLVLLVVLVAGGALLG